MSIWLFPFFLDYLETIHVRVLLSLLYCGFNSKVLYTMSIYYINSDLIKYTIVFEYPHFYSCMISALLL